ncbi:hypothetical protein CASFOL_004036 [Castilleja foliolosa]|uniref:Uncharacterized protein n=1 Tax=Castilleja foliolosa TaxID=1961234 RepID=A0ABD3EMP4_9LAMI
MDRADAKDALKLGAKFLMSPAMVKGILDDVGEGQALYIPGATTPTEIISNCGMEGIDSVIDSVKRRISRSQQAKDTSSPSWWRLREDTLFALAFVADLFLESEVSWPTVRAMLEHILSEDMATGASMTAPFFMPVYFRQLQNFLPRTGSEMRSLLGRNREIIQVFW